MGRYLGRIADEATRMEIRAAASGASEVRFLDAGLTPPVFDPAHSRLNIMVNARGIIRDARCG
ncbi:hypothetical protein [Qipengyuania nanhaisediminis]|uniref:hypothetical protein n=1 Tax=Qipengyuania nanhaisediminis TaxID=604088 RepID=UPI0038B274EC